MTIYSAFGTYGWQVTLHSSFPGVQDRMHTSTQPHLPSTQKQFSCLPSSAYCFQLLPSFAPLETVQIPGTGCRGLWSALKRCAFAESGFNAIGE